MFADAMAVLIESCLRASVVLCAAWALTLAMRRASASTRHFIWICAIAGSVLASAIGGLGPRWIVPVPSPFRSTALAITSDAGRELASAPDAAPPVAMPAAAAPSTASTSSSPAGERIDLTFVVVLLWAAGALCVLAYVVSGAVGGWWIRRSAAPLHASWIDEAQVLAEAFEIQGAIAVVESKAVTMPMVCGLWRSVIVMPPGAAEWSDERRRVVVLHELAHIKRRDCLTQMLAQIVCAVYWFNPIVWLAARRLRAERERACDDFVLAAGEKGPDYAAHLLDIAQTVRQGRVPAFVGLAMARPSQLEGRLLAILDPAIRRSSTLHTRLASIGFVLLIAVPAGSVRLQASTPRADAIEAAASIDPAPSASAPVALSATLAAIPSPSPAPAPAPKPVAQSQQIPADAVSSIDADRIAVEIGDARGLEIDLKAATILLQAPQPAVAAEPKTVEALIAALSDSDPDVRQMVVVTLGRMRDPRVVAALLPLLKDSNDDVREQAVFALARTGDARATAAVATMIGDASAEVREQVVHLLGQSRNREAVPALMKALKDSSADVREQAAFALGQLRDVSAVDPLLESLRDSAPDVREQAAFALGQLRDTRALPGLTTALRDTVADVRKQAAFAIGQISGQQ